MSGLKRKIIGKFPKKKYVDKEYNRQYAVFFINW